MSLSDKLSLEDREAYAREYTKLARVRDSYVAAGDQQSARRIRRQISALSSYYQKRAKPFNMNITGVWFDESSQFTQGMWDKIKAMDFGDAEARIMAHITSPHVDKSWCLQQIAVYREVFKKFFNQPRSKP